LPEDFDFDHSLLRSHIDQSTYVITYVRLIPERDQVFIKHSFPAGLPYLNMGFDTVETTSYSDNQHLSVNFEGRFEHLLLALGWKSEYSEIHYGVWRFPVSLGVGIRENIVSRSDLSESPLTPVGGGHLVDNNALSGSIYFSLVSGLVNYYKLIGESEAACGMLQDYLTFDEVENAKLNINYFPKTELLDCLTKSTLEDKHWLFDYLSVDQRGNLQKDLLSQLIEGKKTRAYLARVGLYEDREALDIADRIAETCRKLTGYQPSNTTPVWKFANCLQYQLQLNIELVGQHPLLKLNGPDIVRGLYDDWLGMNVFGLQSSVLQYAEKVPEMYRALGQEVKSCDWPWEGLAFIYFAGAIRDAYEHTDIKVFVDAITDGLEKIYRVSKCERITVYGLDTRRLALEREGRDMLTKLADDLFKDLERDVVLSTLFNHIETNLLVIASYLESYDAEQIIRKWFNTIQRDPDKWLAQELDYLRQRFNLSKDIIVRSLPSGVGDKIIALFQGLDINDEVPRWTLAFESMKAMLQDSGNRGLLLRSISGMKVREEYFLDPFARQFFAVFRRPWNNTVIERKTGAIRNRTLDKILLLYNLHNRNASSEQRSLTLQIVNDEHADSITDSRRKHCEFYWNLENGETDKALAALDDLIALNEYPYADFYRFARSVVESPDTVSVCPGNPDTAKRILEHLLRSDFEPQYWRIQSGENAFNRTVKGYLDLFILNGNKDYPDLVAAFQSCK